MTQEAQILNMTTVNLLQNDPITLRQLIREIDETKTSCSDAMKKTLSKLIELLDAPANSSLSSNDDKSKRKSDDTFAVLYIVCVMLFFATSLVVVLIKYLMRERETFRMEAFYNNYLHKQPPKTVLYDHHGNRLSDLEIWTEEDELSDKKISSSDETISNQNKCLHGIPALNNLQSNIPSTSNFA